VPFTMPSSLSRGTHFQCWMRVWAPGPPADFLQTALSDLLRVRSLHSLRLIARSSSDRVLTFFDHLPRTLIELNGGMNCSSAVRHD